MHQRERRDLKGLTGTYGNWTIICEAEHETFHRNTHYLCECICGHRQVVKATNLVNGKSRSCGRGPCRSTTNIRNKRVGVISGSLWNSIKRGALVRQIEFDLTQMEASDIWEEQEGRCALTGTPLELGDYPGQGTASLDRIDSASGYRRDNVWWILKDINFMKGSLPLGRFIELCRRVADHND